MTDMSNNENNISPISKKIAMLMRKLNQIYYLYIFFLVTTMKKRK